MRNLFEQHAQENEKQAKAALTDVAARTIGKYISYQGFLNKALSGGGRSQEDGDCLMCIIHKTTIRMAKLEQQMGQIQKTWKLMFGEDMDVESITEDLTRKFYPLTRAKTRKEKETGDVVHGMHMPDDMPADLREAFGKFAESLKGNGKENLQMHVIDGRSGDKFGIKPEDFDNPMDYIDAVASARESAGKPGEEIIKENIIHNVEGMASEEQAKPRRTKRVNFGQDKKPKMN